MQARSCLLMAVLVVGLTSACGLPGNPDAAGSFAGEYFEAIRVGDLDKAMTFYSPDFYKYSDQSPSQDDWRKLLLKAHDELGELREYRLTEMEVNVYAGTGKPSGTYYTLVYVATYANHSVIEALTLFTPFGGNDQSPKIIGHTIR